jgi:endonuclease YncB( thermonuclease family)
MERFFGILLCVFTAVAAPQVIAAEVTGRVRVIDGDTFDVGRTRVRLFGIDAPEQAQSCTSKDGRRWRCGAWVSAVVTQRFQDRQARCVPIETDRYGRTVARCYVQGRDVAKSLVEDGLAFAYRRYSMDYDLDEKGAAIRGAGLHDSSFQAPAAFRQSRTDAPAAPTATCTIKGNISANGERIYHSPGQRDYDRTRIRENKGERWFCSAAEARAAGWRPARR